MPVIVFDLDDTLYEEITFVRSGFRAVAAYLHRRFGIHPEESYAEMIEILDAEGRGRVFDRMLALHNRLSVQLTKECLAVYRSHEPAIALAADAVKCLEQLAAFPIYIVTDGNKLVQRRKLQALGLLDDPRIRRCFITRRFGVRNEKPSPYCFLKICELERANPEDVIYIGDNPNKDFVGIKPLGFRTVRILRGAYAKLRMRETHEADRQIRDLAELKDIIFE
ncbi:HAD family hydrolase [Cohnella caldifontis]|uniref:HAD family hydrolase n=1 Tax=Cohnella caldifontis TaxID=3027471 RepID=UPI0023ECBAE2|nr:HAD family hydrolase [Cohnella sp. YIM B05605]